MTDEDAEKLKLLSAAIDDAIAARSAWLDEMMPKYAEYKIGEELFNLDTGVCLGTVHSYYRYWTEQNPLYDKYLDIEYKLHVNKNPYGYEHLYDNTSRHAGRISIGNRADLQRWTQRMTTEMDYDNIFGVKNDDTDN